MGGTTVGVASSASAASSASEVALHAEAKSLASSEKQRRMRIIGAVEALDELLDAGAKHLNDALFLALEYGNDDTSKVLMSDRRCEWLPLLVDDEAATRKEKEDFCSMNYSTSFAKCRGQC